ncbi:transporter substrate-binding domain-containing protein [Phytohabitans suffuscus]|uniref:Putative amino acid ABC transporter, substrate-binding protein n=1 Tax=Phytohabitans suffuscus TaxID=624315 RepID=A0A6F8YAY4_9ACTN|nr:transporter substrate-binding domain-containing protein [Phytohabitans suffuscus]BCB83227.1 putative amino acid ABC transporter, substrate-binding protein [Phytohabitans suffuscus]
MRTARPARLAAIVATTVTAAVALAACGDSQEPTNVASTGGSVEVTIGALSNGVAKEVTLTVKRVDSIRAQLPAEVRDSGTLVIGLGELPNGTPPLGYIGEDQKTFTGSEPDLGRLVAAVLGLTPKYENSTWENLFVGIDGGRSHVGIDNITVTEQRKLKYDFASYREDNLAFEVRGDDSWNFDGTAQSLAGKTVSVGAGTNQEKILLQWQSELKAQGKTLTVKHFPDYNTMYIALAGRQIDIVFRPNPSIAYHMAQVADTPNPTRNAGTYSGAGKTLQGLIAATVKKDSGLAKPIADAINHLIQNGQYATWLDAWGLANEKVATSEVNPPGLPLSNS